MLRSWRCFVRYNKYPSYKDSGVDWLGEIPENWELIQSRRLFQERKGRAKKGDVQLTSSQKYGVIPQKEFMELEGRKVTLVLTGNEILKHIESNDFVISMRSFQGGLEYSKYSGSVSSAYVGIIPIKHVNSRFFTYLFKSKPYIQALQSTSNLVRDGQALRFDNFSLVDLMIIPEEEQQTIANYLDIATAKIDTLIEKQTKLIELLKEKRQAVISAAVTRGLNSTVSMKDSGVEWLGEIPEGWELSKLRYVFSFGKGLTITKANLVDKGIHCVNYGEIHSKYGFEVAADKHKLKCVDISYLSDSKSSLLSMGDFIFADTSEDIEGVGNFTHVSSEAQIFAGYHTIIARQVGEHNFRFLAYLIDSEAFRTQIRLAVKGVKVFSITQAILRASIVWLPKKGEQQIIANHLDDKTSKIDNLITKSTKAIDLLKEKRTALISSAVTGKIDVREIA